MKSVPKNVYNSSSLKVINVTFDLEHTLNEQDVFCVNTFVHLLENSRSSINPQKGDIVQFTNRYGDYIPDAYVDTVYGNTLHGLERSLTPYVYRKESKVSISLSGCLSFEAPLTEIKYKGKEKRDFCTWGHCGICGHGSLSFQAEVSAWEYKSPNPFFRDFTTKEWVKYYIYYNRSKQFRSEEYVGKYTAWKTKKELDEYIENIKGTVFPGFSPDQLILWGYREESVNIPKEEWLQLDLPTRMIYENGYKQAKLEYDDTNHMVYQYYFDERRN